MVSPVDAASGDKIRKGKRGEEEARKYLESKGYRILERNFRAERGEIDLITMDGDTLVFVEVKAGMPGNFGEPEDRVDVRKQKQIGKVALAYLTEKHLENADCRFDVVSVVQKHGRTTIRHIEDAFWL
jgi:putative endonuclease